MRKLIFLFLVGAAFAQNQRIDSQVIGAKGPISSAAIAVCTQPANTNTQPCSPLAILCSSLTDTGCTSPNPITSDTLGNFHFYVKQSELPVTVQIFGPQVATTFVMADQSPSGAAGSTGIIGAIAGQVLVATGATTATSKSTHYVDCSGNDGGAGTSPTTAWRTIAKVNSSSFNPGDSILFKRGCTWREQLIVPSSGSTGNVITFGAYGSGAKPIINGSIVMTGWTLFSGSIYSTPATWGTNGPNVVFSDGTPLTMEASTAAMVAGSYFQNSTTLYVWTPDGSSPSGHTIEATQLPSGPPSANTPVGGLLQVVNHSFITFDNLDVQKSNFYGAYIANTDNVTIQNSSFEQTFHNAITPDEGSSFSPSTNLSVLNNTFSFDGITRTRSPGFEGIAINPAGVRTGTVSGNSIDSEYGEGITVGGGADSITVSGNKVTNDGQIGIYIYSGFGYATTNTTNITVTDNYVFNSHIQNYWINSETAATLINGVTFTYNVGDTCAQTNEANLVLGTSLTVGVHENLSIYNNTFSGCWWGIRAIQNAGPNIVVKNNILSTTGGYALYMLDPATSNFTFDYDLLFRTGSSSSINWSNTAYTLPAFVSAIGQESHGVAGDPLFANSSSANFSLQLGSPAIDAGVNLGTTYQLALDPVSSLPTANQNSSGTGWEIGAYVSTTPPINTIRVQGIKSTTGQRFVCVDTAGNLVSSATACSGT